MAMVLGYGVYAPWTLHSISAYPARWSFHFFTIPSAMEETRACFSQGASHVGPGSGRVGRSNGRGAIGPDWLRGIRARSDRHKKHRSWISRGAGTANAGIERSEVTSASHDK